MKPKPAQQLDIDFGVNQNGYSQWQQERDHQLHDLSLALGLPVGHRVEIRLASGIQLLGRLDLNQATFDPPAKPGQLPEFRIGKVSFAKSEIESFIRLD